jgi:hypothetical protein
MRSEYSLPRLLAFALRGLIDLAAARAELSRIKPSGVLERNRKTALLLSARHGPDELARSCDEAAFIISRMAARVPWRSDCLVQALAGQRWLARQGITSEIVVGTAKGTDGTFDAHAWLRQGDRIVLGGDISRFQPLLEPDTAIFRPG